MRRNGDLGLERAEEARERVREEKFLLFTMEKEHFKQNERFLGMTGITLQEKSFRNMIDFNKPELLKILKSEDQNTAISRLPKNIRRTLVHNGIITKGWHKCEITVHAKKYLGA
jgi:hypothetical protein